MGINTVLQPPNSRDLAPCDFWLYSKLRGCCYETIEEMKEAVMKVIDALPWGLPEVIGMVEQVHCSLGEIIWKGTRVSCVYYQYKCPNEQSLETYLMILVYMYIYNFICICVYIYLSMYIYIFIYVYIYMCVNTYICIYYACEYIYVHIYISVSMSKYR